MNFSSNFTYGMILEVGEKDVLVNVNDTQIEIELTDDVRATVFRNVEAGIYLIPVDVENKRIVLTEKSNAVYEMMQNSVNN